MLQSHVIDIDGRFVGVAIRLDQGYRFIATDPRAEDLGETIWPRLEDIQRLARRALAHERFPEVAGRRAAPSAGLPRGDG